MSSLTNLRFNRPRMLNVHGDRVPFVWVDPSEEMITMVRKYGVGAMVINNIQSMAQLINTFEPASMTVCLVKYSWRSAWILNMFNPQSILIVRYSMGTDDFQNFVDEFLSSEDSVVWQKDGF